MWLFIFNNFYILPQIVVIWSVCESQRLDISHKGSKLSGGIFTETRDVHHPLALTNLPEPLKNICIAK